MNRPVRTTAPSKSPGVGSVSKPVPWTPMLLAAPRCPSPRPGADQMPEARPERPPTVTRSGFPSPFRSPVIRSGGGAAATKSTSTAPPWFPPGERLVTVSLFTSCGAVNVNEARPAASAGTSVHGSLFSWKR